MTERKPNLQNIPTRTELGREIREAFVPNTGDKLRNARYDRLERVQACQFCLRWSAHPEWCEHCYRPF